MRQQNSALPVHWTIPEPAAVFEVSAPDGASIFVRRHGNSDGPRLVLCHGNGFAVDAYFPFWSRFADRFDIFVYDLRCHGWNPVGSQRIHNLATFAEDGERVVREIDLRFGGKPRIGVFHSLSTVVALRQMAAGGGGYSALILYDPPVCPPGGLPGDMVEVGRKLRTIANKRRDKFETPEAYAEQMSRSAVFERVPPEALDLLARTTLRPSSTGTGYELCCPREYEAQVNHFFFMWAMTVDFGTASCPVKAIGADPTVPNSYMPTVKFDEIMLLDYDFVPETSHLLQIEEPEICADRALQFLDEQGLA